jgi:hypothetical protein
MAFGAMVAAGGEIDDAAPRVYQGSIVKGVFSSLGFQAIAFFVGISLAVDYRTANRGFSPAVENRLGIGWTLMALWGITHWAMALPMVHKWKRRGETRTVKGLYLMSFPAALASAAFGVLLLPSILVELSGKIRSLMPK